MMRVYVCAMAASLASSMAAARGQVSDRTRALHQDALVFDAHGHVVDRQFSGSGSASAAIFPAADDK